MQRLFLVAARKMAEGGGKIVTQVVVSVAATICVGLITNSFLPSEQSSSPSTTSAMKADPIASTGGSDIGFGESVFRVRVAYPTEVEALLGPLTSRPFMTLASTEWSGSPPSASSGSDKPPVQPKTIRKPISVSKQNCSGDCGGRERNPAGPALALAQAADTQSQHLLGSSAIAEADRRVRLLGLPMPRFVPSGEIIVKTITSVGEAVTDLVDGG